MDIIFFFGLLIPQLSVRVYHKKVFSGNVDDWETEQMSITCYYCSPCCLHSDKYCDTCCKQQIYEIFSMHN